MGPKVGLLSLGCPRNIVDFESIASRISSKGYRIVDIGKADIALVNTCAFTGDAKEESIEAILDLVALKNQGRLKKIIVCGCLSQRYKTSLTKHLPEVDAFVGCPELCKDTARLALTPRHYAYLKICEGCVNNCSYCIIPKIKGKFSSLSIEAVLEKAASLEKEGISELNIIGQDISGYGLDLYARCCLDDLVKRLLKKTTSIKWLRLLYLNPNRISRELLRVIADNSRICRYLDLPVQHINTRILKLMNRKCKKSDILSLITRVRKAVPGVALRTSIIVGFPGESEKEFRELEDFIRDTQFERLGAFIYSREEGTSAYKLSGHLPQRVKEERFNRVMSLQQEIARKVNMRFLGKVLDVLVDGRDGAGYLGRSQFDAPEVDGLVYLGSKRSLDLRIGQFVKARITDTLEYDLVGEVLS